jgi:transposase
VTEFEEQFMEAVEGLDALEVESLTPRPADLVPELPPMSDYAREVLRESMRRDGQLTPILVTNAGRIILDGVERWSAARALGLKFIQCRIVEVAVDNSMAMQNLVWASNVERRELLPEHRAMAIKAVGRLNWSSRRLAAWLDVSISTARRLRLAGIEGVHDVQNELYEHGTENANAQNELMGEGSDGRRYPIKQATPEEILERRARIRKLKSDGFSIREIALLEKVSVGTVSADLEAPAPDPRILDKTFDPYELTPKLKRSFRAWVQRPPREKAALAYALLNDLGRDRAMEIFKRFQS